MTAVDALGYLAASLVLATFCAKSMVILRLLAIASNLGIHRLCDRRRTVSDRRISYGHAAAELAALAPGAPILSNAVA